MLKWTTTRFGGFYAESARFKDGTGPGQYWLMLNAAHGKDGDPTSGFYWALHSTEPIPGHGVTYYTSAFHAQNAAEVMDERKGTDDIIPTI